MIPFIKFSSQNPQLFNLLGNLHLLMSLNTQAYTRLDGVYDQVFDLTYATGTSLVAQTVKNLPAMWETQVQSLGQEVPLEKEMATHSSILAWRIPWMEEAGRLRSMGLQRVRQD